MLVFCTETPLLRQVFRKPLVEGLPEVFGQHGQEFKATAVMLVCGCRYM
jgi:hypothetical protein